MMSIKHLLDYLCDINVDLELFDTSGDSIKKLLAGVVVPKESVQRRSLEDINEEITLLILSISSEKAYFLL
jgi:hypothetical protein